MIGLDYIIMGSIFIISIVMFFIARNYQKKIQNLAKKNPDDSLNFGRSIITGMVSGVIVLALDRIFTKYTSNPPKLDFSSLYNFLISLIGIIIIAFFIGSFIFLLVFYIIHKGLKSTIRKNKFISKLSMKKLKNDNQEKFVDFLKRENKKNLRTTLIFTFLSILFAFFITYFFFLKGVESSTPVSLMVTDSYDLKQGRLYINVTNTHPSRPTGTLYLYKLEIDPNKPEMINESGIAPRETIQYSLTIKYHEENVTFKSNKYRYGFDFTPPAVETYYILKHNSVSYKVTCDNCPSQGVIRRIPCFGCIEFNFLVNRSGIIATSIPIFEWVDYKLEDIKLNQSKIK